MDYVVIANNEIKTRVARGEPAQIHAKVWSKSSFQVAKVIYLPTLQVIGVWNNGERVL